MKALLFNADIQRYIATRFLNKIFPRRYISALGFLKLIDVPFPPLPSEDWVIVRTEACGICGSDLNALLGRESISLEPYASLPSVMGHEAVGRIYSCGSNVTCFKVGTRVAVEPILSCVARGIYPPCGNCTDGNYSLCENFRKGALASGVINGFNSSVGGGFGEYFPAHKSQIFRLPEELPVTSAVLSDALASALQPVADNLPESGQTVLVYGCGIIGILVIASLRALGFKSKVFAIARHDYQAHRAGLAGADQVIRQDIFREFTQLTGASLIMPKVGKPVFEGGVDIIFDCVGSSLTIDNSLRFLRPQGKLVIVGTSGKVAVDTAPIWFKKVTVVGSPMYSMTRLNGKVERTYQIAINMIAEGKIATDGLTTHTFNIADYKQAINVALNKGRYKSLKVAFVY